MTMMMLRTVLLLSPNNLPLKLCFLGWAASSTHNTKGIFSEWFVKLCFEHSQKMLRELKLKKLYPEIFFK